MANWHDIGRAEKRIEAASFFMRLYNCKIPHVCIENPRGIMSKIFRLPDNEIHPYFFGDNDLKRTNLWMKNLPPLKYTLQTNLFEEQTATERPQPYQITISKRTGKKKNRYFTDAIKPGGELKTGLEKSKSFPSIANACAEQFTEYLINLYA